MTPLNTGDAISAGSFSRSYSFTPQSTGMFLVCGYVALPSGWPLATQSEMFDVGQAAAAITLSTGAKLAAGIPAAISAAGSTQVARKVWVFVDSDSRDICASDPEDESALTSADRLDHGDAISAGTYSKTYRYTADHPGSYLVCGYVADSNFGTVDASTETIIHATTPAATVKVSAPHTAPIGHEQVLTVSGTSARQQLLDVMVCPSSGSCSRISSTTGTALEDLTVNGSFTKTFTFTPHRFGRYTVTAKVLYMGQSAPANFPTSASSSRSFNVPPTRQAGRVRTRTHRP